MEYRKLGKTDMNVSVLGFGGSEIGYEHVSLSTVKKLLNEAIDVGLNVIDTAECYVTSEDRRDEAIGERRKDYYLFQECGHDGGWGEQDFGRESVQRSCVRHSQQV